MKDNLRFWLLFILSIAISAVAIAFFVKALKIVLYLILVLALTPIVYVILRSIIPGRKNDSDKLKTRD